MSVLIVAWSAKLFSDISMTDTLAEYFEKMDLMERLYPVFPINLVYVPVMAVVSLFSKHYEWKGRRVT